MCIRDRCLIHNPELLILDEPASGLDPRARFEMKEILRNLSDMGKTILISSHILPELSEMCTNIGIIEKGQIVLNGAVDEIVTMITSSNPLVISTIGPVDRAVVLLKEDPLVDNLSFGEREIRVNYKGNVEEEALLLKKLVQNDVAISSFKREEGNLESLFMQITSQKEEG